MITLFATSDDPGSCVQPYLMQGSSAISMRLAYVEIGFGVSSSPQSQPTHNWRIEIFHLHTQNINEM